MLISARIISSVLRFKPDGVIHIGAHLAEEFEIYQKFNWGQTLWIDAVEENTKIVENKIKNSNDIVIQALAWSESGKPFKFNITNNGHSSSVLKLAKHAEYYPDIVVNRTIEIASSTMSEIIPDSFKYDMVVLDIQGAELPALIGFGEKLDCVKYVYSEINKELLYENCTLINELDAWLKDRGFVRLVSSWTKHGWGDALYVKNCEIVFWQRIIAKLINLGFRIKKPKY